MKQTQYQSILSMLRKAGSRGCTVRDLLQCTNYPSARIFEMTNAQGIVSPDGRSWGKRWVHVKAVTQRIDRTWREVNGRRLRVYVLRRV